jgi:hypothetical protein
MRTLGTCAVAMALLLGGSGTSTADPKKALIQVDMMDCQGDPLGSRADGTIKVFAMPSVTTLNKRPASACDGATALSAWDGEQELIEGVRIAFIPERLKNERIRLRLVLEQVQVVEKMKDGVITQTTRAVYSKTVEQGKVLKLRLGKTKEDKQRWVEITARDAK